MYTDISNPNDAARQAETYDRLGLAAVRRGRRDEAAIFFERREFYRRLSDRLARRVTQTIETDELREFVGSRVNTL